MRAARRLARRSGSGRRGPGPPSRRSRSAGRQRPRAARRAPRPASGSSVPGVQCGSQGPDRYQHRAHQGNEEPHGPLIRIGSSVATSARSLPPRSSSTAGPALAVLEGGSSQRLGDNVGAGTDRAGVQAGDRRSPRAARVPHHRRDRCGGWAWPAQGRPACAGLQVDRPLVTAARVLRRPDKCAGPRGRRRGRGSRLPTPRGPSRGSCGGRRARGGREGACRSAGSTGLRP